MLVRKIGSCKYTKGDSREGKKKNKGYKKTNSLKISLKEGLCRVYLYHRVSISGDNM